MDKKHTLWSKRAENQEAVKSFHEGRSKPESRFASMFKRKAKPERAEHSSVASASGAGGSGDRTRCQAPGGGADALTPYKTFPGGMNPDGMFYLIWESFWEARKIVDIPPGDMTREGWAWTHADLDPERIEEIEAEEQRAKVVGVVHKALQYERLYGAGAILLGTAEVQKDPAQPLDIDKIGKGDLRFLRVLPRRSIIPNSYETDPFSEQFNSPLLYNVNGRSVHKSRLIIFDGGGDLDPLGFAGMMGGAQRAKDGFGTSVLLPLWDDIVRSAGSRQGAYQLVNIASIMMLKAQEKKGALAISKSGADKEAALREMLDQASLYRGMFIDGYDAETWSASFGSVPELVMTFLQVLSAASDIPAARFIGQAPGGLNATGKSDLVNYYDMIKSKQELRLRPRLNTLNQVVTRSALGFYPKGLKLTFNPLMQLTEDQKADSRTKDANNIYGAVDRGLMDDGTAWKELTERDVFLNSPDPTPTLADLEAAINGNIDPAGAGQSTP